jgi:hypothetical protein
MQAAAHGKSNLGISKKTGEEYVKETPKKKRRGYARLQP